MTNIRGSGIEVTDLMITSTLGPDECLCDDTINFIMHNIVKSSPKCHYITSLFFEKHETADRTYEKSCKVFALKRKVEDILDDFNIIFMPANIGGAHWVLFVLVLFSSDEDHKDGDAIKIFRFDSLANNSALKKLVKKEEDYLVKYLKNESPKRWHIKVVRRNYDDPQQPVGSLHCGVSVLHKTQNIISRLAYFLREAQQQKSSFEFDSIDYVNHRGKLVEIMREQTTTSSSKKRKLDELGSDDEQRLKKTPKK